jgi:hypothetical protein
MLSCLQFFSSAAAALPCEEGQPARKRRQQQNNPFSFLEPSKIQQAWHRRVQAARQRSMVQQQAAGKQE